MARRSGLLIVLWWTAASFAVCAQPAQAEDAAGRTSTLEHARALLAAGNAAEAVSLLAPLLSTPDTGSEALVTTAHCHQAMGNFAKAADAYTLLLKDFPNSDLISRDLRLTYLECQILAKRWPEAIALAGECVKVHPGDAALFHFKAGACEVQRQDYARAITYLESC